jgi:Restriction alleviation protein Lar
MGGFVSEPTELLPCPCCDGLAVVAVIFTHKNYYPLVVKCDVCALSTWEFKTREEAVEAWNRRANRWSSFSDEELKLLDICLECSCRYDEELDAIQNGIEDELRHRGETREMREWPELTRRHATGEGEK